MKIIRWIFAALTMISSIITFTMLPETIPVHFDFYGNPDRYGSRFEMLLLPVILVIVILFSDRVTKIKLNPATHTDDKESQANASNIKVTEKSIDFMCVFMFVINAIFLYNTYILSYPEKNLPNLDFVSIVGILMGVCFIYLANYMPKTRKNGYIGLRLPWTRYNDNTWRKSNLFASYAMMISGIVTIIGGIFFNGVVSAIIMTCALLTSIFVSMIYAYIVYRDERKKDNEGHDKK